MLFIRTIHKANEEQFHGFDWNNSYETGKQHVKAIHAGGRKSFGFVNSA